MFSDYELLTLSQNLHNIVKQLYCLAFYVGGNSFKNQFLFAYRCGAEVDNARGNTYRKNKI